MPLLLPAPPPESAALPLPLKSFECKPPCSQMLSTLRRHQQTAPSVRKHGNDWRNAFEYSATDHCPGCSGQICRPRSAKARRRCSPFLNSPPTIRESVRSSTRNLFLRQTVGAGWHREGSQVQGWVNQGTPLFLSGPYFPYGKLGPPLFLLSNGSRKKDERLAQWENSITEAVGEKERSEVHFRLRLQGGVGGRQRLGKEVPRGTIGRDWYRATPKEVQRVRRASGDRLARCPGRCSPHRAWVAAVLGGESGGLFSDGHYQRVRLACGDSVGG